MPMRRLRLVSKDPITEGNIMNNINRFGYFRMDAVREEARGKRDLVLFLILSGKHVKHVPDLRKLIEGLQAEDLSHLDEIIFLVERPFFTEKSLIELITKNFGDVETSPDYEGLHHRMNIYDICKFSCVIPEHSSVPPHRILSPSEADRILSDLRTKKSCLPVIFSNDAPIIWAGGRVGETAEVMRPSETAMHSIAYRYIVPYKLA